jgi:penicillin-binding protein 1A
MWMDFMRVAIANKPNEAFPQRNAPKKELDVPPPTNSPVVKQIPKAPAETDADAPEPDADAGPKASPQPSPEAPANAAPGSGTPPQ